MKNVASLIKWTFPERFLMLLCLSQSPKRPLQPARSKNNQKIKQTNKIYGLRKGQEVKIHKKEILPESNTQEPEQRWVPPQKRPLSLLTCLLNLQMKWAKKKCKISPETSLVQKSNNVNHQIIKSFTRYTKSNSKQIFFIQIPVPKLMNTMGGSPLLISLRET